MISFTLITACNNSLKNSNKLPKSDSSHEFYIKDTRILFTTRKIYVLPQTLSTNHSYGNFHKTPSPCVLIRSIGFYPLFLFHLLVNATILHNFVIQENVYWAEAKFRMRKVRNCLGSRTSLLLAKATSSGFCVLFFCDTNIIHELGIRIQRSKQTVLV